MERWRVTRGGVRSVSGSSSSSTIIMLRDKDTDHAATATANVDRQPPYYYNNNTIKQQQQLHVDVDRYSSTTSISVTADQEISIFDAHKYFNQLSINNHIDGQNHKVGRQYKLRAFTSALKVIGLIPYSFYCLYKKEK